MIEWYGGEGELYEEVPKYVEVFLDAFYEAGISPTGIKLKDLSPVSVGYDKERKRWLLEVHRDIWLDPSEWLYVPEKLEEWTEERIVALRDRVYQKMLEHFKDAIEKGWINVIKDDTCDFVSVVVHIYIPPYRELRDNRGWAAHYAREIIKVLPEDW